MYTQDDLKPLYDIWIDKEEIYPPCIKAQAETYISILSDTMLLAWTDGLDIEEDTFDRAMWFVELVKNGEGHIWYDSVIPPPIARVDSITFPQSQGLRPYEPIWDAISKDSTFDGLEDSL